MKNRIVTDADDRTWTCRPTTGSVAAQGRDVVLSCTTESVPTPVRLTVGWQWEKMAANGLARLIALVAPARARAR